MQHDAITAEMSHNECRPKPSMNVRGGPVHGFLSSREEQSRCNSAFLHLTITN
jgi:hypothetical protein